MPQQRENLFRKEMVDELRRVEDMIRRAFA